MDIHLYRDGQELPRMSKLPPRWDLSAYPGAARVDTDWTFTSAAATGDESLKAYECTFQRRVPDDQRRCGIPPMLMLGYDLGPMLSLTDTVRPGQVMLFRANAYRLPSLAVNRGGGAFDVLLGLVPRHAPAGTGEPACVGCSPDAELRRNRPTHSRRRLRS